MPRLRCFLIAILFTACGDDSSPSDDTGDGTGPDSTTATGSTTGSSTQTTTTDTTATTMEPESTTGPDTADSEAGECPMDYTCLPLPEAGWMGPFTADIALPEDAPTPCPEGWTAGEDGLFGIEVTPFDCSCTCADPPVGASCEFEIEFNTGFMCNGTVVQTTVAAENECVEYAPTDAQSVRVADTVSQGECGVATYEPPVETTWMRRIDACVPEVGDACAEGSCVPLPPAPFVGRMCIVTDGEVPCPEEGPYDVPYVLHEGADDTRACDCTCEPDVDCTGTLQAHGDNACSQQLSSSTGTCISFLSNPNSARVVNVGMMPECNGVAGPPTGEVVPTGVRTMCCTED